jgi:hypothetical protein
MPKVTYKCIDCGKERTGYPSSFHKPREQHMCQSCAAKKRGINAEINNTRDTYTCIDCGSQCTDYICNFSKPKEIYRCHDCACKHMAKDPIWRENTTEANRKMVQTPEWRSSNKKAIEKIMTAPNYEEKCKERGKVLSSNIVWKENHDKAMKTRANDPEWKLWRIEENKKMAGDPYFVERRLIVFTGEGYWYGNKILRRDREYYCELWNDDLKGRIDAAYDYKSILSGNTKFDNGNISLTHHHLYWEKKACCVWDEDAQGYYAWIINNGKKVKYYIKGDPNKFVLLTISEHGKMYGNKREGTDKIYWIKYLEDLVEQREKEGKKCYLSPEEYEIYKVEHKDIIDKYKK